ncbi:hypothetical protein CRM22_008734 [Opisthorchis felineus]|uniref:G-protein coupled receptors family 1 profile domain-containing protein n=1 Tax=Opisthorchis felineus TaxID=147828 RepID=A0A4S2LAP7_OPIFE|nr:hypothetical protein CRM22_008734 [Opisthorchis felineus]TGZ60111.1 hypothetical protein CRM22_008734 [Opisthorchis felineus]TGZ60112.1 hypothetical protein CRM22_008734 [Opisthorchis felineus]TGZ60114.1 hypothetical protein CRM22_008734 [Opisthorchis felineus]
MNDSVNLNTTNLSTVLEQFPYDYAFAVVYLFVQTPLCTIGMILNVLNICVFSQPAFSAPAYIMMKFLSLADAITLGVRIPQGLIFQETITHSSTNLPIYIYLYNIYVDMPITNMTEAISAWLTVLLAVERYVSMKHWHVAKRYFTVPNTKRFIYIIIAVAVVFCTPYFALQNTELKTVNGTLEMNNSWTPFYESNYYATFTWLRAVLVQFIPLTFLCNTNLLLFCLVTKHNRKIENRKRFPEADGMSCVINDKTAGAAKAQSPHERDSLHRKNSSTESESNSVDNTKHIKVPHLAVPFTTEQAEVVDPTTHQTERTESPTKCELLPIKKVRRKSKSKSNILNNGTKTSAERMQRRRGAQQKLTILLIVVILLFLIGQVPQSLGYARVFTTLGICSELEIDMCSVHQTYRLVSVILAQLAFSSTFFVYLFLNRNFRNTLQGYLPSHCCHCHRKL